MSKQTGFNPVVVVMIVAIALIVTLASIFGIKFGSNDGPAKPDHCEALYQQFHRGEPHDAFITQCHDSDNFLSQGN